MEQVLVAEHGGIKVNYLGDMTEIVSVDLPAPHNDFQFCLLFRYDAKINKRKLFHVPCLVRGRYVHDEKLDEMRDIARKALLKREMQSIRSEKGWKARKSIIN